MCLAVKPQRVDFMVKSVMQEEKVKTKIFLLTNCFYFIFYSVDVKTNKEYSLAPELVYKKSSKHSS